MPLRCRSFLKEWGWQVIGGKCRSALWSADKEVESRTGTKTQDAVFANTVPHRSEQGPGLQHAGVLAACHRGSQLHTLAWPCHPLASTPTAPPHFRRSSVTVCGESTQKAHLTEPSWWARDAWGAGPGAPRLLVGAQLGAFQGLALRVWPSLSAFCMLGGNEIPAVWSEVGLYVIQPPASYSESVRRGQAMRVSLVPVTCPPSVSLGGVPTTDTLSSCSSPV